MDSFEHLTSVRRDQATLILGGEPKGSHLLVGGGFEIRISGADNSVSRPSERSENVELPDCLAMPALVDVHAHVGPDISRYGVHRPDRPLALLSQGDAGPANIEKFLSVAPVESRYALSIARFGEEYDGPPYGDAAGLDVEGVVEAAERHRDSVWGLSANLDPAALGEVAPDRILEETLDAARQLGLSLVFGSAASNPTVTVAHIESLRRGDVITYLFRSGPAGLFDDHRLVAALHRARERGVVLDASHGKYSFDTAVARLALEQGLVPDTLSSDTSTFTRGFAGNLQLVALNKMLALGMELDDAIQACTTVPGDLLGVVPRPLTSATPDLDIVSWADGQTDGSPALAHIGVVRNGRFTFLDGRE